MTAQGILAKAALVKAGPLINKVREAIIKAALAGKYETHYSFRKADSQKIEACCEMLQFDGYQTKINGCDLLVQWGR